MNEVLIDTTGWTTLIDVSDWGGPDIPYVPDMIEVNEEKLRTAMWKAFSDGVNAFVEDLAIEIHPNGDICLYETAGFETLATIPADKVQRRTEKGDSEADLAVTMVKDYLV